MNKENLINDLLEFLTPVIIQDENKSENDNPALLFLSRNEVQTMESLGSMPTNKVFDGTKLVSALAKVAKYDLQAECKDYATRLFESDEKSALAFIERDEYDPNLLPDHIYHYKRYLLSIAECYEIVTGKSIK